MSSRNPEFEDKVDSNIELQEPFRYRVILHNDHYTTMDFVVEILETVFNKKPAEAVRIMLNVHKQGIGECGIYTAEVAETKVALVESMARQNGFPLKCSMEEM